MVEEDRPYVVKMPVECEQTSSCLVRPDFDLIVVSSGNEEWLGLVKVNATDWTIMLLKSIDQRSHAVIP